MPENDGQRLLAPGDLFGDYTVEKLLGKGGMGAVYLVRSADGERYAVKVMFPEMGKKRDDYRERFLREGEFARKIRHPNLIAVYEVRVDPSTGLNYIVMEYAPGGSLRDRLDKNGRYEIAEAVEVIRQIAYGLAAAHQHGVIHRDIKPDNILFAADGTPKLADLGVAKFTDDTRTTTMTAAGEVVGTPAYMAPEQMMNAHKVDSRADIYALGVVFYEMLVGKRPNEQDTFMQLLAKAVKGIPIPSVRKMRPEVSASLVQVINVMCAIRASDRFDSSQKLIDVFERLKREGFDARLGLRQPPNRRRRRLLAAAMALGMLVAGAGAIAYDRNATFVEYYREWVDEWGIPSGRWRIDAKTAEKSNHYKFEYRGRSSFFGKRVLRRVTHKDCFGFFTGQVSEVYDGRRPEIMEIAYDESGGLAYIDHVKPSGRVELRCLYSGTGMRYVDFKLPERGGGMVAAFIPDSVGQDIDGSGDSHAGGAYDVSWIRRHVVTRDQNGRISKIEFMANDSNEPVADGEGFFGIVFERDRDGNVNLVYHVDERGNAAADPCGVVFCRNTYDASRKHCELAYLDASTNAVLSSSGFAYMRSDYDDFGRCVRFSFHGVDGRLCLSASGFAEQKYTFDEDGNRFRAMKFGIDGLPIYAGCYGIEESSHDASSTRTTFLDADGKPAASRLGYATVERLYEKGGCEIEERFFDVKGDPVIGDAGYHIRRKSYDSYGNLVGLRYYGIDGALSKTNDYGFAAEERAYDMTGRLTRQTCLDEAGRPCKCSRGYAVAVFRHDSHGNLVERSWLDETNAPCITKDGYAMVRFRYDAEGRCVRNEYLSEKGKPIKNNKEGVAAEDRAYDACNRMTELRYYDESGSLCNSKYGYATFKKAYDASGRVVARDYFAPDGSRTGCATRSKYDMRGREILREYLGKDGTPAVDQGWGCARMRMRYDDANRCIERSFFDEKDAPMLNKPSRSGSIVGGVFRIEHVFDELKGSAEDRFYGLDGRPSLCNGGFGGVRCFYDKAVLNSRVYVEYLGIGGTRVNVPQKGYFGEEYWGDANGKVVKLMFFDADYNYVDGGGLNVWDSKGRNLAFVLLGANGRPRLNGYGCWGYSFYDANGNFHQDQIREEEVANRFFAQGMPSVLPHRNRYIEEWKKVRHEKVPKPTNPPKYDILHGRGNGGQGHE